MLRTGSSTQTVQLHHGESTDVIVHCKPSTFSAAQHKACLYLINVNVQVCSKQVKCLGVKFGRLALLAVINP